MNINRATTKGIGRHRQSAWCCGHNYQRWRLESRRYPNNNPNCKICGKPLKYRFVKNPSLERYYRNRDRHYELGLTGYAGNKPKRFNRMILTPKEKAWNEFRAQIPAMPISERQQTNDP